MSTCVQTGGCWTLDISHCNRVFCVVRRFVVSDCGEIRGLDVEANHGTSAHPYTKQVNGSMSCQAALRGGCDVDCGSVFGAQAVLLSDQPTCRHVIVCAATGW